MVNKKHTGLLIGIIFSIVSFLLTFTFVVPIYTTLPGSFLEQGLSSIFPTQPFPIIGMLTISILSILFILVILLSLQRAKVQANKGKTASTVDIILMMLIIYCLVHPLAFYLHLGIALDFHLDAQYLFNAVYIFPFSSLSFVIIGFLMDYYWNMRLFRYKSA